MTILYIYAHPHRSSFNEQLKQHALDYFHSENIICTLSDLYQDQFNPVASWQDFRDGVSDQYSQYFQAQLNASKQHAFAPDIAREQAKITAAKHLIFQFPLWWFGMPAILKGWFDRILAKGFAYDTGKIFQQGLLTGKTASLMVTTQSPAEAYQRNGLHHAHIDSFLQPIHHTLRFTGLEILNPFVSYNVFNLADNDNTIFTSQRHYLTNLLTQLSQNSQ